MTYIKPFSEISKDDAATAGGKGASLGEMTQASIPVPPGFVILAPAFQKFLEDSDINIEIDSILKTVDINAMHTIENASAQIQALILEEKTISKELENQIIASYKELNTEFVAVRSSATAEDSASAAWAGQLDSYLNTTEATLLENVRHCWASLFTPRAIYYRFEKQLDQTHISVAVVVQKMVNSDAAGIAFSVHPVTEDRNQIIIEAALGLGEAVVSGQITPDSYVTTKKPRAILDKNVIAQSRGLFRKAGGGNEWRDIEKNESDKQVLSDDQILALSDTVMKIENHYGFPCDIEWAMENGEIYIVQSRPITTLTPQTEGAKSNDDSTVMKFTNLWEAKYDVAWTEICASIYDKKSPFKSIIGTAPNNVLYFGNELGMTAYYVPTELENSAQLGYKAHAEEGFIDSYVKKGFEVINSTKKLIDDVKSLDLHKLSNDQLADLYEKYAWLSGESVAYYKLCNDEFQEAVANEIRQWFVAHGADTGQAQENLMILASEDARSTLDDFNDELARVAVTTDSTSAEAKARTVSDSYGWMGTFEEGNFWDAEAILSQAAATHAVVGDKLERKLKLISSLEQAYAIPHHLKQFGHQMARLANLKLELRLAWAYRDYNIGTLKLEIMHRLSVAKDDFYFLRPDEIVSSVRSGTLSVINEEIRNRRKAFCVFINDGFKQFYSGDTAIDLKHTYTEQQNSHLDGIVQGQIAMRGKVTGIVKLISPFKKLEDELKKIEKGDILVTGMTRPQMIPAMNLASAFVTDEGGVTCHAAIIAREMRKPCIIATRNATKVLKDGDLVEVDGDNGVVRILTSKTDTPYFSKENSVFTFESKGTSFLFEDIVASYYLNWPSLTLGNAGVVRVFVPKDEVIRLNKTGASLTNVDVTKRAEGVKTAAKHMEVELPDLQKKKILTKEDVAHVFQRLAELCINYSYFDIHYSDGMWESTERDPEAKRNVDLVQKYKNEIRDLLNMPFFTPDGWLMTTLSILSKQFNVPLETLQWYRETEILSLFDKKIVSEQDIAERRTSYALYIDKESKRIVYAGDKARQLHQEFEIDTMATSTQIKGIVAHGKGRKVQGKVKIIQRDYGNSEIARQSMAAMNKGDILVSETTDPELMDALKKAAAIVTDVGGMLSHAAITARELDTPCIIGTEIASKILKDGDLVEVDADKGIVRILNT